VCGDAAALKAALPPTIQRIAGSWRRRSASFTSSYPAKPPEITAPSGECGMNHVTAALGRPCRCAQQQVDTEQRCGVVRFPAHVLAAHPKMQRNKPWASAISSQSKVGAPDTKAIA
jgi:hypothetical protein